MNDYDQIMKNKKDIKRTKYWMIWFIILLAYNSCKFDHSHDDKLQKEVKYLMDQNNKHHSERLRLYEGDLISIIKGDE